MKKILLAMSGGVDSTVAALLLKEQGYEVGGATFDLLPENGNKDDIENAAQAAAHIGIPHFVIDMKDTFSRCVISDFRDEYLRGGTPNPCIECNRHVKFGEFLNHADRLGYDFIATGHYAKVGSENGRFFIKKASDSSKDQSYVLYPLGQEALSRLILPLGDLTKTEIREIAAGFGLSVASKRDSQDICFIPDGDYVGYLCNKHGIKPEKGDYIDSQGNIIGKHSGIINYTLGQRKGLGITFGEPRFVTAKDAEKNTVTLGKSEELFSSRVKLNNVNLQLIERLTTPLRVTAKTRYSQKETDATLSFTEEGYVLDFDSPVRAASPGQSAVFYAGERLIGGGKIV